MLTTNFFANLLDMSTEWQASAAAPYLYEGRDRATSEIRWIGTAVDLVFGSNSQIWASCEVYASGDDEEKFIGDFIPAWNNVMNLDRFDLPRRSITDRVQSTTLPQARDGGLSMW